MRANGCEFLESRRVTDFLFNEETGCISEVVCGREKYTADAVVLAVGISTLQDIIKNRHSLSFLQIPFPFIPDADWKSVL